MLKKLDFKGSVVGFEVDLGVIPKPRKNSSKTKAALKTSDFQSVTRDFAFVVENNVTSQDLKGAVKAADKNNIIKLTIFDVFEGIIIGEEKKSIGVEVKLQSLHKTFTDDEIEEISNKIVKSVNKITGGTLR